MVQHFIFRGRLRYCIVRDRDVAGTPQREAARQSTHPYGKEVILAV
ncbi:MAG: hypothetical protein GY850_24825 [bacterium]|nr:hypothetical protein [bacterium]